MSKEVEGIYIGCMSVKMGQWNPGNIAKGCIVLPCSRCNQGVYVAPTSQKFIEDKKKEEKPVPVHLICMQCIEKRVEEEAAKGEEVKFMGAVPGAFKEAIENIAAKEQK